MTPVSDSHILSFHWSASGILLNSSKYTENIKVNNIEHGRGHDLVHKISFHLKIRKTLEFLTFVSDIKRVVKRGEFFHDRNLVVIFYNIIKKKTFVC